MEEEIKKTEYKNIYELEQECIRLTTDLKKRGMYKGFKDTLTKLYTKSGHFVFELIQNAEDCDAEEIIFDLKKEKLLFQHNGKKLFTLDDVDAITNVGNSTKNENGNSIGKFGVGFKSVFEYTNTPEVHSGNFHFIIKDMYIPHPIENLGYEEGITFFNLPFDIIGKSNDESFNEISETLKNLHPETLLFLRHIKKIICRINTEEWILERKDDPLLNEPKNLCKLSKIKKGIGKSDNTNYVRFFEKISVTVSEKDENDHIKEYEKNIEVGIAFKAELSEKTGWSIKPILFNDNPAGRVFTFFPCEAEKSGLCFHIHAPFALTVDREKLRDEPGNLVIKKKIVDLLHSSLKDLKNDNLLNMDFLKTLPNKEDDLGANENNTNNYEVFKNIFEVFNNESFTPMENGLYEPARDKLRSKNRISSLFSDEDMNLIYGTKKKAYWIKNPRQMNQRDDKFIQSLACTNYNLNNFLDTYTEVKERYDNVKDLLEKKSFVVHDGIKEIISRFDNIDKLFASKKVDWFCKFYVQLNSILDASDNNYDHIDLQEFPFCYCSDSKLYKFSQCYYPNDKVDTSNDVVHLLNDEIYAEFKKNEHLRDFFETLRMQEYSEIKSFESAFKVFIKKTITIQSFISIFRKCRKLPDGIDSFSKYFFNSYSKTKFLISVEKTTVSPNEIYLTEKYGCKIKNCDLYYKYLKNGSLCQISEEYLNFLKEEEIPYFVRFLTYFGCRDTIVIKETSCTQNRNWDQIWRESSGYGAGRSAPTDIDFNVDELDGFLKKPNYEKFEFVWSFLSNTPIIAKTDWYYNRDASYCYYRTAQKYELKKYSSELRNILVESNWVAQEENGKTIFVTPSKAYLEKLPEPYKVLFNESQNSNLNDWFNRIDFGKEEKENEASYKLELEQKRKEKEEFNKFSEKIGVPSDTLEELGQALNDGTISVGDVKDLIAHSKRIKQDLEEFDSNNFQELNVKRISEKAKQNFDDAEEIASEKKERTVRTTNTGIKESAKSKLRNRYTNIINGNMTCQLCRNPMPFKDKTDNDYFVTRQLFSSKIFEKELDENYVALCPTCDAKYKVYMAQDEEKQSELKKAVIASEAEQTEFDITLDDDYKLYFSKQHIISLYSCLSGITIESPKKAVIVVRKKSDLVNASSSTISTAFCINCQKTFNYIKTKPVISCPNCKTVYKNSNGTIQLMNTKKKDDIFFDCPYCKRRIQKIHKDNHLEKCRGKNSL